jgi:hypothetical protein
MILNDAGEWFESMGRFQQGGGNTVNGWLPFDDAEGTIKTTLVKGRTTIPNPRLTAIGNVQPSELARHLTARSWANGFACRILLASPPGSLPYWNDREAPRDLMQRYEHAIGKLLELTGAGKDGIELGLTEEARSMFIENQNHFVDLQQQAKRDGKNRTVELLSKHRKLAARHALAHHVATLAGQGSEDWQTPVSAASMRAGIRWANWISRETLRAHNLLTDRPQVDRQSLILGFLERHPRATARMILANFKTQFTMDGLIGELETMHRSGLIESQDSTGPGRPTRFFSKA